MTQKKRKRPPPDVQKAGPPAQRLIVEGDWTDAVRKAMKRGKPLPSEMDELREEELPRHHSPPPA